MKKMLSFIFALYLFLSPIKACAVNFTDEIENLADDYDISIDNIPDITIEDVIEHIVDVFKKKATTPVKLFVKLAAVVIICALTNTLRTDTAVSTRQVTDSVCTIILFLNLMSPMQNMITIVKDNLSGIKNFMAAFLPIYSGITMASGEVAVSAIYTGFFLTALVFTANFAATIILPSIQMYFAIVIANVLSPYIRLKSIGEFYVKAVKMVMRAMVSGICFILTIQTTIAQGSDTLAVRTGKVLVGTAIPVIGSVLQDAIGSVYAGMEVIKGFAGAVGIIAIAYIFVPSVVTLAAYWICTSGLYVLCDVFDVTGMRDCVQGFISVIELLISLVSLFAVMLIFSLTIIISLTNGA